MERLVVETHTLTVELARWPESVTGFGHVRARKLAAARPAMLRALDSLRAQAASHDTASVTPHPA